jgi:hypothetical protein
LWSSNDESDPSGGEPIDKNYDIDDVTIDCLRKMAKDCEEFQKAQAKDLAEYVARRTDWNDPSYSAEFSSTKDDALSCAGHDFWLTRNRHGAGFWDRYLDELGQRLTDASHGCGEANLYVQGGYVHHY